MSAWYLSLSGILPPFSKAHTEGKNLENDTETLHQNRLSAYVAIETGKGADYAENEQEAPVGAGLSS